MKYLLPILFITILMSCKKDPIIYKYSGQLTDKNTASIIPNATIKFYQKKINVNALNPNYIFVGETTSDSEGNYTFEFLREKILEIKVEVSHGDFYGTQKVISSADISTENVNIADFKMESKAWISVRLYNSFVVQGEQLNFYKHNVKEGCSTCCTNGYTIATENTPDTTFVCNVIGDVVFNYTYGEVTANTSTNGSIYCVKGDTNDIYIQY